ncbi:MAG: PD-(D/E)XK nuclease family protein, partial [Bifidobacterium sp.]|nr:PD-(D/E)XK nuclease family protein [Bifidobacterium sp.]
NLGGAATAAAADAAAPAGTPADANGDGQPTLEALGTELPRGYFVGDDAQGWENAVVGDAWTSGLASMDERGRLPWPYTLSEPLRAKLLAHTDAVEAAIDAADAVDGGAPVGSAPVGPLSAHAALIAGNADLGPLPSMDEHSIDAMLQARAARILAGQRLNATALQRNAAAAGEGSDARRRREAIRGILRPIPQMSSPAALAGTRLHAWAERFMLAGTPDSQVTRAALVASARRDLEQAEDADERRLAEWKLRLADSPWASRTVASAEQSIVATIEDIPNLVQGKLDAVFYGGLDGTGAGRSYTVVDWKTGHRPRKDKDIADKLRQLDFYRLLLARERNVPLANIDAALYYVSEEDPALRQLNAEPKGEEEILAELRRGIPQVDENE